MLQRSVVHGIPVAPVAPPVAPPVALPVAAETPGTRAGRCSYSVANSQWG